MRCECWVGRTAASKEKRETKCPIVPDRKGHSDESAWWRVEEEERGVRQLLSRPLPPSASSSTGWRT